VPEPVESRISSYGETFAEALEQFLGHLSGLAFAPDPSAGTRAARFQSEAATLPDLARNAYEAVMAIAADFESAISRVLVDGHRPIEGGHRCWGTVEIAPNPATGEWVAIVDGPRVSLDEHDGRWRIDIGFVTA
jgi:hypothetical protein